MDINKSPAVNANSFIGSLGISTKFLLSMFIGMVILFSVSSWVTLSQEEKALNELLLASQNVSERNNQSLSVESKDGERKKAEIIARLLAASLPVAIAEFDMEVMASFTQVAGEDEGITFVEVKNSDGATLAKYGNAGEIVAEQVVTRKIASDGIDLGEVIIAFNLSRFETYMKTLSERSKIDNQEMSDQQQSSLDSSKIATIIISVSFMAVLLSMLWFMFKIIVTNRLDELRVGMRDIAEGEGDLTKRMQINGDDEIDKVGLHYNQFLDTMHSSITLVSRVTSSLEDASKHLYDITETMRNDVSGQQEEIGLVATAVYEMSMSIKEVANNASKAAESANDADKSSREGQVVVDSTIDLIQTLSSEVNNSSEVIDQVKADSQKIGAILDVIREIANQTNLLALNAAIEAARAGDSGRGFAVVADEVRALASRTQQSTVEIQNMIEQLQSGSENAVSAMEIGKQKVKESVESASTAGGALQSITNYVTEISDMNNQISCAADEQTNVSEDVNKSITRIKDVGVRAAESTKHTANSSQELSQLSSELKRLVGQFKL